MDRTQTTSRKRCYPPLTCVCMCGWVGAFYRKMISTKSGGFLGSNILRKLKTSKYYTEEIIFFLLQFLSVVQLTTFKLKLCYHVCLTGLPLCISNKNTVSKNHRRCLSLESNLSSYCSDVTITLVS